MKTLNEKQVRQFFHHTEIIVERIDEDFYALNLRGYRKILLRPTDECCQNALKDCREAVKIITDINAQLTYSQVYYFFSQNPEFNVMQVYEKKEKLIRIKLTNHNEEKDWYVTKSTILHDCTISGIIKCICELQKEIRFELLKPKTNG